MTDYISREAAKKQMRNGRHSVEWLLTSGAKTIGDSFEIILDEVPAADVRPVVRGRWERMYDNDVLGDINCKCSACGEDWWQGPGWFRRANFCPNCGADMREADDGT